MIAAPNRNFVCPVPDSKLDDGARDAYAARPSLARDTHSCSTTSQRFGTPVAQPKPRASASSKPALDYLTASGAAAISIMHIMASEVDLSQHRLGGWWQPRRKEKTGGRYGEPHGSTS